MNPKYILLVLITLFFLASCKKDFSCECVTKQTNSNSPNDSVTNFTIKFQKRIESSTKKAKESCTALEENTSKDSLTTKTTCTLY